MVLAGGIGPGVPCVLLVNAPMFDAVASDGAWVLGASRGRVRVRGGRY